MTLGNWHSTLEFHQIPPVFYFEKLLFSNQMTSNNLPVSDNHDEQLLLKNQIRVLKEELETVEQKTLAFESVLRTELAGLMIEVQELTVLYKQQKLAKKAKRLEQKKRGKHYKVPEGLKPVSQAPEKKQEAGEGKEMKRLYREAMLHVHPDKFSMAEEKQDLATEVTTKLIDIYHSGDLKALQAYHGHIFSGNALEGVQDVSALTKALDSKDQYLENEKERLEGELAAAKNTPTYKVLIEYDDPMSFLNELRVYYRDRLSKLRRRTRS